MANFRQVMANCKIAINDAIYQDVSPYLIALFKHKFETTVYSQPEGEYERTRAALNSVTTIIKKTGNQHLIQLFANPDLMNYEYPSWFPSDSQNNKESIIDWLNNGTNSPYYSHPAWNFIGATEDTIAKELNNLFIKALRKRGINARAGRSANTAEIG